MDWKVYAALTILGVALVVGLVFVVYTSVSKYAREMAARNDAENPAPQHDQRPTV